MNNFEILIVGIYMIEKRNMLIIIIFQRMYWKGFVSKTRMKTKKRKKKMYTDATLKGEFVFDFD